MGNFDREDFVRGDFSLDLIRPSLAKSMSPKTCHCSVWSKFTSSTTGIGEQCNGKTILGGDAVIVTLQHPGCHRPAPK